MPQSQTIPEHHEEETQNNKAKEMRLIGSKLVDMGTKRLRSNIDLCMEKCFLGIAHSFLNRTSSKLAVQAYNLYGRLWLKYFVLFPL